MKSAEFLRRVQSAVGVDAVVSEAAAMEPYLHDWRDRHYGSAMCVVRPTQTSEVSAVLALACEFGVPVFPQGGNTSVCGGSVPSEDGNGILLSLSRMNRVLEVNPTNNSITVQGGCILQDVQEAARAVDRLFPLSLGAEGSCQIGGNIATNAGGTAVLRYGNMRDLVLGLEVVLPDGRVLDVLRTLRKDNTGYDLKNLFTGSEGTLGVITAAALKLFPLPKQFVTTMVTARTPGAMVDFGLELQERFQGGLIALELISSSEFEIVMRHIPSVTRPFSEAAEWYVLAEVAIVADHAEVAEGLEACLASNLDRGVIDNAVIAASEQQRRNLWNIRHHVTEANRCEGMGLTHDIGVPLFNVPEFLERAATQVQRNCPQAAVVVVGHLGDGNLHYIVMFAREQWDQVQNKSQYQHDVGRMLYDIACELGGTFSAEHGIGSLHVSDMTRYKSAVELQLMHQVKHCLDPKGIMNPGRVLPSGATIDPERPAAASDSPGTAASLFAK